jgi:hypothetical protein
MGGPRVGGGAAARTTERDLVTHPDSGKPAVWFHDDSVEPGKTYRYRTRVQLWNRYVGQMRAMKNPEDAKKDIIRGEWSEPSDPITVTPTTHFFVSGSRATANTASVEVWKWLDGRWIKERFDVAVGDIIGGLVQNVKTGDYTEEGEEEKRDVDFTTGAVVLDLRFEEPIQERWPQKEGAFAYREKTSTIMVYLDPADGQVKERALVFDRRDPVRKQLEEEAWW